MRVKFFQHIAVFALVSIGLASVVSASPDDRDDVAQAYSALGAVSAKDWNSRMTIYTEEFRAQAIRSLPTAVREKRSTQGRLLRRVESVFQQVLRVQDRDGRVELFLFPQDVPLAQLYRGCVLMLSENLAEQLNDAQLAGVLAHELGHSYFEDEMAVAQHNQDARGMRVVELKCDAVAMMSLKLMGQNPAQYLQALRQIQELNRRMGRASAIEQTHPALVARAQLLDRMARSGN